jgi:hypothetical protein
MIKCPKFGHISKWHVYTAMISVLNVIEVMASRAPSVELPDVIVSRSSHDVDGMHIPYP